MSDPCQYNDDIQNLKKAVFIGNGQPSLLSSMANIITKIDNIHTITNTWDAKMDGLLDFMAGEKALKAKRGTRITWSISLLAIGVAIISIYLSVTKTTAPQVRTEIREQKTIDNNKKSEDAKTAAFDKEMKSQLKKDTVK